METFESQFPPDFRKYDIEQILSFVLAGKFCQLISLPGGGKATLLKLLARNENVRRFHLGAKEKSTRFVYLNLLELENYDQPQVDELILHSLKPDAQHSPDPFILSKQLIEETNKLTSKGTLVFLFDHFDEFQNKLSRSFFQRLRTIKNEVRFKFAVVFATRRDLRQLVDPEIRREFYDFFVANSVYMKLYDPKATEFLFTQIENVADKKLSTSQKKGIIAQTSGHTKITKACTEAITHGEPIEKESLLTNPLVRASLFELWLFLTAEEQHVLTQIVKNTPINQNESVENLINFGLLIESKSYSSNEVRSYLPTHRHPEPLVLNSFQDLVSGSYGKFSTHSINSVSTLSKIEGSTSSNDKTSNNFEFTIPLFEDFVRTNATTLHREKISFNQNTKEITKGEEVISDLLSPQENRLLKYLIENEGKIIDREEIISAVWPEAQKIEGISDEAIDQMIFRLRKKIEDEPNSPRHITTVKGRGFRFQP